MRKKYLFVCFLTAAISSFAQTQMGISSHGGDRAATAIEKEILDTSVLRVQYRMEYVKNVKKPAEKTHHYMLLQIGKKISKFSDYFRLKTDSMHDSFAKKKISFSEASSKIMPIFMGTSPINIFKNYPAGKITVIDNAFISGTFKYTEDKIKMNWKMEQGTAVICGYECKKATTSFRGRNYTVWYAPKIPYSDGPWKFWGLPGLILKAVDDKNEYSFECAAIEKVRNNENIYLLKRDYFNTTRERFNITAKRAYENPNPALENMGSESINVAIPYNPIEIN